MVEFFDNRIEMTNPGSLLVEVERVLNDPPKSRNEVLSVLMRRFSFFEEAGSGWDTIIAGCKQYQLPAPKIEGASRVRVTLRRPKPFRDLTPDERLSACSWHAYLRYGEGEYATNASLREIFGVKSSNSAQISRLIELATEKRLIKPVDPDISPRYMKYEPRSDRRLGGQRPSTYASATTRTARHGR